MTHLFIRPFIGAPWPPFVNGDRSPPRIHLLQDFAADFTRPSVLKFAKRQACDPSDGRQILRCNTQRLFGNFPRSTATWPAGENQRLKRTPCHSKWPFYPLLGGHQQPLKGTRFHHPRKVTSRIAWQVFLFLRGIEAEVKKIPAFYVLDRMSSLWGFLRKVLSTWQFCWWPFWGCEKVTLSKDVADPQLGEKVWSLWITWQVVFGGFLLRPNPIESQLNLNWLDFATQFVKAILLNDCFNN